jgi:hypothetical protein
VLRVCVPAARVLVLTKEEAEVVIRVKTFDEGCCCCDDGKVRGRS